MASSAQAKEFIAKIAPIIQGEAKQRGYLVCSPIIAQACIESGFDTSLLSYKYHNYFGMKCGSSWKGRSVNLKTKEEVNSTLISIRDNFRVYPDMVTGINGYFDFISTKRYANLKTADNPEEYLRRIKADGYATSSSYVNTCMNCVRKYDLEKWDWNTQEVKSIDEIAKEVIAGKWGNGAVRKQKLRAAGYNPSMVQAKVNDLLKNK
jgi:flagellum-specific peptidoglycan hydrolase FlgJ